MYKLPYFTEKNRAKVIDFMKRNEFVTLCGSDENNFPVATQIPVLFSEKNDKLFLRGHFMRNTDHHRAFVHNPNVLAVFTGPHCYVSASWYGNPQQASTWNYMTVQTKGVLRLLNDEELIQMLKDTTTHYENDANSAASFDNLPKEYVERLSKGIVAFEIEVTEMDNVFKLSQNRDEESFETIIDRLQNGDHNAKAIAEEMQKIKEELFQKQPA
jgi:transcriptional regulator